MDRAVGWRFRTYPLVVLAALGLAVVATVVAAPDDAALSGTIGGDLPEFVGAGRIVAAGDGVELYEPARQVAAQASLWPPGEGGGILFAYPAALAAPYAAADGLDYRLVYLLHTGAMLLALVGAVRLLVGRLPLLSGPGVVPLALAASLTFLPMFIGVFNGQTTALPLLLLVGTWVALCDGRDLVAGAVAGLLLLKPQYGLVVIGLLVVSRRPRAVAAAAASAALLWAVSALVAGPGWTGRWWALVRSLSDIDDGANLANEVSPVGLAELVWGQGSATALAVGLAVSGAVALALLAGLRRLPLDDPRVPALVLPSLLLVAPHALYYDVGLLLVSLVALLPTVAPDRRVLVAALWWAAGLAHLLAPTLGVEPLAVLVALTWLWALRATWSASTPRPAGRVRAGPTLAG